MTNAVATRDNGAQAVALIQARSDQFLDMLGGDERARDRWLTVALHAVTSNHDLLRCTPESLVEAVRASASMGLELNGLMGEGYLIRYGDKAQFQVGWRGLLRLARRSGDIAAIDAQVVYDHDEFDVDLGSDPRVTHKPALSDRGKRVGAYGWARLTSGELVVEWMDNDQLEAVRRSGSRNGPWVEWFDEMARKTVIKRLCKRLPLDSLAQKALEVEARADNLAHEQTRPVRQGAPNSASTAVQRVQARLGVTTSGSEPIGPAAPTPQAEDEAVASGGVVTPRPADMPPPPETASQSCEAVHDEYGKCNRAPDHKGNHMGDSKETWKDA